MEDNKSCELDQFIEQVKIIVGEKLDKFEKDIKESMNELKIKVDEVHMKQSTQSERLNSVESKISTCDTSRIEQGKRLGELERNFAVFEAVVKNEKIAVKEVKKETTDWVRWLPSIVIGIVGAVFLFLNYFK